ncbi:beta strand repeat-containing protein, partial [Dyella silvatica]|uniref:beta strand repeat-containing protein n=1 Tax=Dyella silvatica TaxID=2992128 RepID=UPI002259D26C
MADPNSKGQHVDEICWLQLDGVTLTANGSTPLTFALPDGSTMTFTAVVGNVGASAGLGGVQAPSWSGSQFSGSSGYYTVYKPNKAVLYTNNGSVGNDTSVTLQDIHLFNPNGVEATNNFEVVIADGESTNSGELLDFGVVSGGSPLRLVEWLGATQPGNNVAYGAPGSSGIPATPTSACDGMIDCQRLVGKSGTANAAVFSTTKTGNPFTVVGQVHTNGSSLQGFAFGVRWGGARLRKALPSGRMDPADQITYRVFNVQNQEIINTSTSGAASGNYPYISGQAVMPGNLLTFKEEMAPGSKSTLAQYDKSIVCSNGNAGSNTALPNGAYDPNSLPTLNLQQLGDHVDCTLTNIPRVVDLNLLKSGPATVLAGQPLSYTLTIRNNGSYPATGPTFSDTLPVGITGVSAAGVSCGSATGGAVCGASAVAVSGSAASGYTVTGAVQSLPANGSVVITINATAPASAAGVITNTATVQLAATDTTVGEPASKLADNTSSWQTTVQGTPSLQVSKTANLADSNGNGKADVGEVITYAITATNNGSIALSGLTVSDPMAGSTALACTPTAIDPGKSANCGSFAYTVTQADVDAGNPIHNVATVNGSVAGGGTTTSTGTADTPVGTPVIIANNDSYPGIGGATGGVTGNVVANDLLGAVTGPSIGAAKGDVTLSWGSIAAPPAAGGLTLNADGSITVKPGTTAGTYNVPYTICDAIRPTDCAHATAIVTVTAGAIAATNDSYTGIDGGAGNPSAGNVLSNDTLNGAAATPATVTTTVTTPASNPNVSLNPATGEVSVAPGTPAGTYTIGYQICEKLNPANCASATATVVVVAGKIVAGNDNYTGIDGGSGNPPAGNVLSNDTLNGAPATPATVTTTVTTPASNPNVSLNPATGEVSVAPGTPAGTYTIGYQICEKLNPTNCTTATVTVTVAAGKIVADNDSYTGINGGVGNPSAGNVLGNDTLNGAPATPATVTTTVVTPASNPNVSLNPATGEVSVAPGTPAGTYTIGYQICEKLNPANCATATATITTVVGAITAGSDNYTGINGGVGNPNAGNVLGNDTLNGAPATTATVTMTVTAPASNPNVSLNPANGQVSVAPGTPAGTYTIGYQICEKLNPTNCATTTVTVTVDVGKIVADNDSYTGIDGGAGNPAVGNVLGNDTLNGAPATPATVTTTVTTPASNPNVSLNPATGEVSVAAGTPAGTYSIGYQICEKLNPTNCSTATATVTVIAGKIVATNDSYTGIDGSAGNPNAGNALDNDTLNGAKVTPATVTATVTTPASNPNVSLNPATGEVSVAPGTPAGTYSIGYQICEKLNPSNCATATITVTVMAGKIAAGNDNYTGIDGGAGNPSAGNVLSNDTLNGAPATPATVTMTVTTPASNPNVSLNPATGEVSVAPGTPAGTYTIGYQICEKLNPTNCVTAAVTVTVVAGKIVATNDSYTGIDGSAGNPNVGNALDNDTLNGVKATPATVTMSVTAPASHPNVSVNPATGQVSVAPGTPAGTYTIGYQICDKLNPGHCAAATISVVVTSLPLQAVPDDYQQTPVNTATGGSPGNVLGNDTAGGKIITDPHSVIITLVSSGGMPNVTINPDGSIVVPAGTPTGNYTLSYRICDVLDPSNCSTAQVKLAVSDAQLLRLSKQATPQTANVGDIVRYTLTVENVGPTDVHSAVLADTPPVGFTLVANSLTVSDSDGKSHLAGSSPIRVEGVGIGAGKRVTLVYLLRVGPGASARGTYVNTAQMLLNGVKTSNVAQATVQRVADPLFEDSRVFGTVFDDRNGDGWQASAKATHLQVQGGFSPAAYVAGSTTVDRGAGPKPEADASAPMLHGIALGELTGRMTVA